MRVEITRQAIPPVSPPWYPGFLVAASILSAVSFPHEGSAMPSTSALARVQDLYDRNLFLDAYHETAEYWTPRTDMQQFSVDELLLAGRLARRLGGERLSRRLFRAAQLRDPIHPGVR